MIEVEKKHSWTSSPQQQQNNINNKTTANSSSASNEQNIPPDLLALLREHSLFQRTKNESFLQKLSCSLNIRMYNPHDIIIAQGEPSKAMFFLLKGQVEVCSADFERIFATLPQGSCFGEIGILYSMPRTATVIACTKCIVAALTSEQVHALLPLYPDVEKIIRFEAEERLSMTKKSEDKTSFNNQQEENHLNHNTHDHYTSLSSSSSTSSTSTINTNASTGSLSDTSSERRRSSNYQQNIVHFSKTGIRDQLGKIPFFFGCSEEFLHLICLSIQPRIYEPNSLIFNQGDMGDEMFFIIDGTVTVETDTNIFAHMGPGDYFGELSVVLNIPRFATIKTVTTVEFFVLNRDNLQRICEMCPDMGIHIKSMAEKRLQNAKQGFLIPEKSQSKQDVIEPQSICSTTCDQDPTLPNAANQIRKMETRKRRASIAVWSDPSLMERANRYNDKLDQQQQQKQNNGLHLQQIDIKRYNKEEDDNTVDEEEDATLLPPPSPLWAMPNTPPEDSFYHDYSMSKHSDTSALYRHALEKGEEKEENQKAKNIFNLLDKSIVARIMNYLDFKSLMQVMCVTKSVRAMFSDDRLLRHIDLATTHKQITDERFSYLMPLIRHQVRYLSLSQCFHLTDTGFQSLVNNNKEQDNDNYNYDYDQQPQPPSPTSPTDDPTSFIFSSSLPSSKLSSTFTNSSLIRLQGLNLNSCWLLTDKSLELLGQKCPQLIELDLSNCRKITNGGIYRFLEAKQHHIDQGVGKGLEWISLSYCKNLNDITMQHLATFTKDTLKYINLQRCTKISDQGFLSWMATISDNNDKDDKDDKDGMVVFSKLKHLSLVDCSFLTDRAIQLLTKAAPYLEKISLSFCCALSDTAMVTLGSLSQLKDLDVSFCGAAVSDASLYKFLDQQRLVRHHQQDNNNNNDSLDGSGGLEKLNIRGCVRITNDGIYPIVKELAKVGLYELNMSQCPTINDTTKQKLQQLNKLRYLFL
ncbi:hypothetical protein BJ944DRAFT_250339 [Cunninghamella echinulata]|nr:hypothetical protein BJ944DRAFT_250339 [Cunninghamella echinulata]